MKPALGVALFLFVAVPASRAGDSISGLWEEVSTPEHKSSTLVFSQDGKKIWVICYWEFKSQKVVWHGSGTRQGKQIHYRITHTLCPPNWDPKGEHELTLSPDGKTMTGTWHNTRQESGPLKFIRKK